VLPIVANPHIVGFTPEDVATQDLNNATRQGNLIASIIVVREFPTLK
jgi:hypothetical protein